MIRNICKNLNNKISVYFLYGLILFFSLFVFKDTIRKNIAGHLLMVNCLAYGVILLIMNKNCSIKLNFKLKDIVKYIIYMLLIFLMCISMYITNRFNLTYIVYVAVPIFIIFIKIKKPMHIKQVLKAIIFGLNILTIFIFLCGICDIFYGFKFSNFFAKIYATTAIISMRKTDPTRIISILGHPLQTAEIMLITAILNFAYSYYVKCKINNIIIYIICSANVFLSGSKTVTILMVLFLLFLIIKSKKLSILFIISGFFLLFYPLGIFDNIISRFYESIISNDFSTGRNIYLIKAIENGEIINLFGSGRDLTKEEIIAFEYPVVRFSFRYGIIFGLLISTVIFIYPLIVLIIQKKYSLCFCLLLLIIDVNTFSYITTEGDGMLIYCIVVFILLNISKKDRRTT